MDKYDSSGSSGGSGAPAGPAGGAADLFGAPPARPLGAPLLPPLPLLQYLIHSCSLPYVIYYFIFDLICFYQPFHLYTKFISTFQTLRRVVPCFSICFNMFLYCFCIFPYVPQFSKQYMYISIIDIIYIIYKHYIVLYMYI